MKKSELRDLVREECRKLLHEMDINDPIAMKLRADKNAKKNRLTSSERRSYMGKLLTVTKKISELSDQLYDLYREQDADAALEPEIEAGGGPLTDEYGDRMNKIQDQISKYEIAKNELESKLGFRN